MRSLLIAALLLALFRTTSVADTLPAIQPSTSTFTLTGTAVDRSRAPIVGARVTATAEGLSAPISAVSDAAGTFRLSLTPGRHTITVTASGFQDASATVEARPSGAGTMQFVLQVAGVRESVTVTSTRGYAVPAISTATKTPALLRDVPQSITVITKELIKDQMMMSLGDVMRYVPGVMVHQGENNRDQVIIRGNSSSADFFVDGVRDDVQYYRDLYNVDRVETLKGPNAMIFGRGGAGGVVNRVSKEAGLQSTREFSIQGGMFGNKRATAGINQTVNDTLALRADILFEDSDSFRDFVGLKRYGITPALSYTPTNRTRVTFRYEFLDDSRTADRGITSFHGRPAEVPTSTFFGNPDLSDVAATVNIASALVEHRVGHLTLRNRTVAAHYDRSYQNFVPGAVSADGSQVTLTTYNNATQRTNVFSQTDAVLQLATGQIRHTLLGGIEVGRQSTDNFRNTGFFNNTATSLLVPLSSPAIFTSVTYRQNATDADNALTATVAAVYAQDQVEFSPHFQILGGLRFDRFDLTYRNNRNGDQLERPDTLVSPRAGIIFKPIAPLSIYNSYSVSYLPSSGDQFSSLTIITEQVKPEQFRNYEVGAKWDAAPGLALTTAMYRVNRTNTRSTDPNDPTRIIQTGNQRTNGYELGVNGRILPRWTVAGGYAYQNAFVTSPTTAAVQGAQVAQVPHHTLSLWNNYQMTSRLGLGLGILRRTDMFATIDNTVTLPGYTRADVAAFFALTPRMRLQANIENLFDKTYYINADSNTNISPGFPRAFRVGVVAGF